MIEDIKPPKKRYTITGVNKLGDRLRGQQDPPSMPLPEVTTFNAPEPPRPATEPAPPPEPQSPKLQKKRRFRRFFFGSKKRALVTILLLLVLAGAGIGAWYMSQPEPAPPPAPKPVVKKVVPPKPTTVASPLTGVQVTPELAKRPVTAIMIENSPDARPQSGLRDAGVVFEAIAEGGITRFATLFQEAQPAYVGPVRSIRPYYLDWMVPFDGAIANVGGSLDARQQVSTQGIKSLDQFFNSGAYWRIPERYAPHNVYTNFERLNALNTAKGYTTSSFTSWARKAEKKSATPTAKTIDFDISGVLYNPHYDYDAASNSYLRSLGGKPHTDVTSQADPAPQQLRPKVVIAMVVPYGIVSSSDGYRSDYAVNGSGPAFIFQDGNVIQVTWSKASRKSQISFKDTNGKDIALNAGQTWISVVSTAGEVSYKP